MPLTKKQLEEFNKQLLKIRKELTHHLAGAKAEAQAPEESKGYSQHQADEGSDDFDRQVNLQLNGEERTILRQVERALEKMDEGSYGVCDLTEQEIPLARLEAIPYATMTRDAQEKLERGLV